ncbi:MAG: metallopeptidase TldD-related protein [Myxococcota bacterium]
MRREIRRALWASTIATLTVACGAAHAIPKRSTQETIFRAMDDELKRSLGRLELETLAPPFYMSYDIRDFELLSVSATLGAVVRSDLRLVRDHGIRVMVGSYEKNDENFLDLSPGAHSSSRLHGNASLPLEDDYEGIRRALWIATDNVYKRAAEAYERKKAALAQQNVSDETANLADFAKVPVSQVAIAPRAFPIERKKWEAVAEQLSALFRDQPDIFSSRVSVTVCRGSVYLINSEGTKVVQPVSYVGVAARASTQAIDGEPLRDAVAFHGLIPSDLPSAATMRATVAAMAKHLVALRTAAPFDESYSGPVLFEGQAAAELLVQRLFTGAQGLLAYRRPVVSDPRAAALLGRLEGELLTERIGKRILPRHVTIKAQPHRTRAQGKRLIGAIEVDADGVRPPDEIVLVENGVLKGLLSNRIPTKVTDTSNGHQRHVVGRIGITGAALGPTVVEISTSKGKSAAELKKELLELAAEEDLKYALVVRRLASSADGLGTGRRGGRDNQTVLSAPLQMVRVDLATGKEDLARSAILGGVTISALRRLAGVAARAQVYNTLVPPGRIGARFGFGASGLGAPASFILPRAILIEELTVTKERRDYNPTLPVLPSPLRGTSATR